MGNVEGGARSRPTTPIPEGGEGADGPIPSPPHNSRGTTPPLTPRQLRAGSPAPSSEGRRTPTPSLFGGASPARTDVTASTNSALEQPHSSPFWSSPLGAALGGRRNQHRLGTLCAIGKSGRPCYLALHTVVIEGGVPMDSSLQLELSLNDPILQAGESTTIDLMAQSGAYKVDCSCIMMPCVTSRTLLQITACLQTESGTIPLGIMHFRFGDVHATVQSSEISIGARHSSVRAQSPAPLEPLIQAAPAPPTSPLPLSMSPRMSLSSPRSGQPTAGPPSIRSVRATLEFLNQQSSGIKWIEVVPEAGKPRRRALLVVGKDLNMLYTPPHMTYTSTRNRTQSLGSGVELSKGGVKVHLSEIEEVDHVMSGEDDKLLIKTHSGSEVELFIGDRWETLHWKQLIKRATYEAVFGKSSAVW